MVPAMMSRPRVGWTARGLRGAAITPVARGRASDIRWKGEPNHSAWRLRRTTRPAVVAQVSAGSGGAETDPGGRAVMAWLSPRPAAPRYWRHRRRVRP